MEIEWGKSAQYCSLSKYVCANHFVYLKFFGKSIFNFFGLLLFIFDVVIRAAGNAPCKQMKVLRGCQRQMREYIWRSAFPPAPSITLSLSFAPPYYVSTLLALYRVSRVCKMSKSFYIKTLIFGLLFSLLLCFCCCIYCCTCCCGCFCSCCICCGCFICCSCWRRQEQAPLMSKV